MPPLVTMGALCQCTFGTAPGPLAQVASTVMSNNMPLATILDVPKTQLAFGNCIGNLWAWKPYPPQPPCAPVIAAWTPGCSVTKINNIPAITTTCTATCTAGGGVITIKNTSATKTDAK